jgi:iron-sulfur cluster assembly accessory protein
METKTQLVTKDMTMGDIIQKYPSAADIMQSYGLHCFGCHVNLFESLEQGVLGHGMSEEQMHSLLNELNEVANKGEASVPAKMEENSASDLVITEIAAAKLKELLEKMNKAGSGIRVSVVRGGCAGYMYNMDFAEIKQSDDTVFEQHGIRLFVDDQSKNMLKGVTVDYVETLQGAGFKFDNPNATKSCGCGKSYH